jgi:predicted hydrolase (HD superfamily)
MLPKRDEAVQLLKDHVKDDYQIHHAEMVAKATEAYAQFANDLASELDIVKQDLYYITGLVHDIDYYQFPDEHPLVALRWLTEWGYPAELIHAVEAHAYGYNGNITLPKTHLAAALMACDELSGFLYAYSLMRPTGFQGMEVKSVIKRLKDKAFAAKINREDIYRGVEYLGVSIEEHIERMIGIFV